MHKLGTLTIFAPMLAVLCACVTDDATAPKSNVPRALPPALNESPAIGDGPSDPYHGQEALCRATNGRWYPGLLSCRCPIGALYSARSGCRALELAELSLERDGKRVSPVGEIIVSLGNLPERATLDRESLMAALLGATIEGRRVDFGAMLLRMVQMTAARIETERNAAYPDLSRGLEINFGVGAHSSSAVFDVSACTGLHADNPALLHDLCETTVRILEEIRAASPPRWGFAHSAVGQGEFEVNLSTAQFGCADIQYSIVGKNGIPARRLLTVAQGSKYRLDALLSPTGSITGGTFSLLQIAPSGASHALERPTVYFDRTYQPVKTVVDTLADKARLVEAAERAVVRAHAYRPVRAALVEGSVNPSARDLMGSFRVDREAVAEWLRNGDTSTMRSIFETGAPRGLEALRETADNDPYPLGHRQHGTQVASVLVAGLSSVQVSLIPLPTEFWLGDPWRGYDMVTRILERDQPQVVNISIDFRDTVDCKAFFGSIFDRYRETTLFVVGAGNDGLRDSPWTCPASIANSYPNVVSVAGVNSDRRLHEYSNYGTKSTSIAAPWRVEAIAGDGSEGARQWVQGTSFSAPVIANAALRAFAARPTLQPAALKRIFLQSCRGDGLDVECGGAWDEALFEKHIRSESSLPDEGRN